MLPECEFDGVTEEERKQQDLYDRELYKELLPEERSKPLKGRQIVQYDYNHSSKGKAARKRYAQTDKGKANVKRKQQKRVASGKNAEACRRYYQRKKEREAAAWTA